MKNERILVIGASGTIGSGIVKTLRAQGFKVVEATKDTVDKHSSNKVQMDLITGSGVKEGFTNIDRAYLLAPPGHDQYSILAPLIKQAKSSNLKKVVLSTAYGANADESSSFRRAEVELEKSGLNYNIIRPNWFLQNFNSFWIQGILERNMISIPAGEAKVSFIDARDISDVAAKLLTSDEHNNKDFDLTSPASITHTEAAKAISNVINREIVYVDSSMNDLRSMLESAEMNSKYIEFFMTIMTFLKEGYNSEVNSNVEFILGRSATSLDKYVKDYRHFWKN